MCDEYPAGNTYAVAAGRGRLDAGCCGLAGNFGFERNHYDISVAYAEDRLLPALRAAAAESRVLADGFSCRTQIRHLLPSAQPRHTAEVLAEALRGESS